MNEEKKQVLVLDNVVLFPNSNLRIELSKELADLINVDEDKELIIVNPISLPKPIYESYDLPQIGVLSKVTMKLDVPNGKVRISLIGIKRVSIKEYYKEDVFFEAIYDDINYIQDNDSTTYFQLLLKAVNKYVSNISNVSNSIVSQFEKITNLDELTDLICNFLNIDYYKKKNYITEINPVNRVKMLIEDMNEDLAIAKLEKQIEENVEQQISKDQKNYYLREKIKVIKEELGDFKDKDKDLELLLKKSHSLKAPLKVKERLKKEIDRYQTLNINSPELGISRDYIDYLLNLPWQVTTRENTNLKEVLNSLNSTHYGLNDVKERIIEFLAVKQNTTNIKSPILCLVGPPGVGKTTLAYSIAKSLNRNVAKISVGGITDESMIIGHRKTYIGAMPGRIIEGIRKAKSNNPVFIIDEIDKMQRSIKGDPASCLLEVLDKEQNTKFVDNYIEEEFDLSKVFFVATANYEDQIPYELYDRMEIINISSYTEYEKFDIAKNYLIPKELTEHGLTLLQVQFEDKAIYTLIRYYTKEAGVRELERIIAAILRKLVKKIIIDQDMMSFTIDETLIEELLGKKKYYYLDDVNKYNEVGVVNGMAYTMLGGDILKIEATYYKGTGNLILTGSLGEVMKESAHIALSYIKSNTEEFNVDLDLIEKSDIHLHVPEGAIKKDGPSAGVTIVTTLISLFTNTKIKNNISMTGEITLRGKVLPVGGLKEKIVASHTMGVRKIFLPLENKKDIEELDEIIRKDINFIFVDNYKEIYKHLFHKNKSTKHNDELVTI